MDRHVYHVRIQIDIFLLEHSPNDTVSIHVKFKTIYKG